MMNGGDMVIKPQSDKQYQLTLVILLDIEAFENNDFRRN